MCKSVLYNYVSIESFTFFFKKKETKNENKIIIKRNLNKLIYAYDHKFPEKYVTLRHNNICKYFEIICF